MINFEMTRKAKIVIDERLSRIVGGPIYRVKYEERRTKRIFINHMERRKGKIQMEFSIPIGKNESGYLEMKRCIWHPNRKATIWSGHIHIGKTNAHVGYCSDMCSRSGEDGYPSVCEGCFGKFKSKRDKKISPHQSGRPRKTGKKLSGVFSRTV